MERLNNFSVLQIVERDLWRAKKVLGISCSKYQMHCRFIETVNDWDLSRYLKDKKQKLIIKFTVLYNFENRKDYIDLSIFQDLACYSSLLAYYNICVSEVEAMRSHEIMDNLTMFEFMTTERIAFTNLTSKDIFKLEREIYKGTYNDTKMYKRLIFQRFEEVALKIYNHTEKECSNDLEVKVQSDLAFLKLVLKNSRDIKAKWTIKDLCTNLRQSILNWEMYKRFDGSLCKLQIRYIVLNFFGDSLDEIINLSSCKDFICYPSLLIYYKNCVSQVTAMEDDVSDSVSVRDLIVGQRLLEGVERSKDDDSSLRLEQLFKKALSGKYNVFTDLIADKLKRPFLINKIIDMHFFALIKTGPEAMISLNSVAVPEVIKYLCPTDLLNLAIAFSVQRKRSVVDKQKSVNKRQMDEAHCSFKHLKST